MKASGYVIAALLVLAALSWYWVGTASGGGKPVAPPARPGGAPLSRGPQTTPDRIEVPPPAQAAGPAVDGEFEVLVEGIPAAKTDESQLELHWFARQTEPLGDPRLLASGSVNSKSRLCVFSLAPALKMMRRGRATPAQMEFSLRLRRVGDDDLVQVLDRLPKAGSRVVFAIHSTGVALKVRVLDAKGNPVPYPARVDMTWNAPADGECRLTVRTNRGIAEIWPVQPGCAVNIYASHAPLRAASNRLLMTVPDVPVHSVKLTLRHGIAFHGRILNQQRNPLSKTRVTAYLVPGTFDSLDNQRIRSVAKDQFHLFTDAEGKFILGLRPNAKWRTGDSLLFCQWGANRTLQRHGSSEPSGAVVRDQEANDLGDVILDPPRPLPVLLSGRVLDVKGNPFERAAGMVKLRLLHTGNPPPLGSRVLPTGPKPLTAHLTWPGPPGRFEFRGEAPPGTLTVTTTSSGFRADAQVVEFGDRGQDLTIRLEKAAPAYGHLLLADGLASDMFFAKVCARGREMTVDVLAEAFHFGGLPHGPCHVSILTRGTDALVAESNCVLPLSTATNPKGLLFDLRSTVRAVSLRVRGPDGALLAGELVRVEGVTNKSFAAWLRTGKSGSLTFPVPDKIGELRLGSHRSGSVLVEPTTIGQEVFLPAR